MRSPFRTIAWDPAHNPKSRRSEVTPGPNLRLRKQVRWHAILRSEAVAGSLHVPLPEDFDSWLVARVVLYS